MFRTVFDIQTRESTQVQLTPEEIAALSIFTEAQPLPDWRLLYGRFLVGDLKPLFEDVCSKAEASSAIALRYFNLVESFKIREEQALKDCLDRLLLAGYSISTEDKDLWNKAIAELNFSDLVKL
jgi:hypothetical protein